MQTCRKKTSRKAGGGKQTCRVAIAGDDSCSQVRQAARMVSRRALCKVPDQEALNFVAATKKLGTTP
jgi:hypothetical protein